MLNLGYLQMGGNYIYQDSQSWGWKIWYRSFETRESVHFWERLN